MKNSGKRLTNEEALDRILKKCKEKNVEFIGFKNDENIYKNNKTYLILKCNKCGNVWDTTAYDKFMQNRSCPNCSPTKKLSEEEIIESIRKICKERDYQFNGFNGVFNGLSTKLKLKCNKCGKEWCNTTYNNFRKLDRKSHTCGRSNPSNMPHHMIAESIVIEKVKNILKGSALEFVSFDENGYRGLGRTHVILKCKECNNTMAFSYSYLKSKKETILCKKCQYGGKISNANAEKAVKEKCNLLNYTFLGFDTIDGRYDGKATYLVLKCNKCGHVWKTTNYYNFMHSTIKCMNCINSWKMEKEIESTLIENNIDFIQQCRNKILPWLRNKISLSLDFYLPKYNVAIECQGRQHFEPVLDFGGEKAFGESIERDEKKLNLCKENGIRLLYYDSEHKHTSFLNEKVYNTKEEIIEEILKHNEQKNKNVSNTE